MLLYIFQNILDLSTPIHIIFIMYLLLELQNPAGEEH